jgi:cell wall-associated NlpC family hydrolase
LDEKESLLPNLRKLIGVPFINGGRDPTIGLDCYGLLLCAFKEFGIILPDMKVDCYDKDKIFSLFLSFRKQWVEIKQPELGCAIAMSLVPETPDIVQHVAVYIGSDKFLHTLRKIGSFLTRVDDPYYSRKIRGFYRWEKS